jgi:hypothetical protein
MANIICEGCDYQNHGLQTQALCLGVLILTTELGLIIKTNSGFRPLFVFIKNLQCLEVITQ